MKKPVIIHVVDRDPGSRARLARIIFEMGYHAEVYDGHPELLACKPSQGLVLAQDDADNGEIAEIARAMSECGIWLPIIAMAPSPQTERIVSAMRAGAHDYLHCPIEPADLIRSVARVSADAAPAVSKANSPAGIDDDHAVENTFENVL